MLRATSRLANAGQVTAALTAGLLLALAAPAQATGGTFSRALGLGVNPTGIGAGGEVCTVPALCAAGESGALGGQLNFPEGVATEIAHLHDPGLASPESRE